MAEEFNNAPQGENSPAPVPENAGGEQVNTPKGGEQINNAQQAPSKTPEQLQQEFLKQLGVNSLDDAKAALDAYKQYQDSQKTEAQKQTEQLSTLQEQLNSVQAEKANLSTKLEALGKGVRADAVDDVIKLVAGAEDVGAAIESLLAKYPQFGQQAQAQQAPSKPSFGQPQYNEPAPSTEMDKWKSVMSKFSTRY